jgi:hypothetical protein
MKILVSVLIFLFLNISVSYYRNIFNVSFKNFQNNSQSIVYENVLLINSNEYPWIIKVNSEQRFSWSNNVLYLGKSFQFSEDSYYDFIYGSGLNSNQENSNHLEANYTKETKNMLVFLGYKYSDYAGTVFNNFSTGLQFVFPHNTFLAKVFFSLDNRSNINSSLWTQFEQNISESSLFFVSLTFGKEVYYDINNILGFHDFASYALGYSKNFREGIEFKYFFEQTFRNNNSFSISNKLLVDVNF